MLRDDHVLDAMHDAMLADAATREAMATSIGDLLATLDHETAHRAHDPPGRRATNRKRPGQRCQLG